MRPLNISSSQVEEYFYEEDAWSSKDGKSMWHGRMTEEMKLDSVCNRAAADMPFAPPKSASISSMHISDEREIEAHNQVVAAIIKYLEEKER